MITKIHTFGSSHTEGGGFAVEIVKKLYKPFSSNPSMETLSWVGQLKELLPSHIDVQNHAASGGGNERMYRLIFDTVTDDDFNKDDTLLLIEPTLLMRKEFWSNTIQDYVILNYSPGEPATGNFEVVHQHYNYNTDKNQKLQSKKELYHEFIKETVLEEEVTKLAQRNLLFLLSFLEQHQIRYLIINEIDYFSPSYPNQSQFFTDNMKSKCIEYYFDGKETYDIMRDGAKNHSISHETEGVHDDFHQGLFVNKVIAQTIYNKLVNHNFIVGNKVDVEHDEGYFKKIKQKLGVLKKELI